MLAPVTHDTGKMEPSGQYEPRVHCKQSVAADAFWNLPAGHMEQTPAPPCGGAMVPGRQGVGCDVPPAQLWPGRQLAQSSVDVMLLALPGK